VVRSLRRLERRAGRVISLATGAAIAYLLDPQDGVRRRAQLVASCRRMLARRDAGAWGAADDEGDLKRHLALLFRHSPNGVEGSQARTWGARQTAGSQSNRNSSTSNVGSKV
jgi:hypothetical protein